MKYFLLAFIGFCGMLVCHFLIFLLMQYGSTAGRPAPLYALAYPLAYGLFASVLARRNPENGIRNAFALCAIPTIYWFVLLWRDHKLTFTDISIYESSGMILIIPLTIAVAMVVMVSRQIKTRHQ